MRKRCSRCNKTRYLKKFDKDTRYRLGVQGWCKSCVREYNRLPERKQYNRRRWENYISNPINREYERKRSRDKYHRNPEKQRDRILRKIGVSLIKFKKSKRCLLCKRKGRLVADHNHKTGLYRGAICHLCNLTLGHIENFPAFILRLKSYLKRGLK